MPKAVTVEFMTAPNAPGAAYEYRVFYTDTARNVSTILRGLMAAKRRC